VVLSLKLCIEDDEGHKDVVPVELGDVRIGRHDSNVIRLNERNVSRKHLRLVLENDAVYAEDLDSYNGVFINGTKISKREAVFAGDLIRVGDFHLELRGEGIKERAEDTTQRTLVPDLEVTQPSIPMPDDTTITLESPAPKVPDPTLDDEAMIVTPKEFKVPPGEGARAGMSSADTQPQARIDSRSRGAVDIDVSDETPTAPSDLDSSDPDAKPAEPTAIIRLEHLRDIEAQQKGAQTIAGEKPRLLCVSTNFAGREFEISKTEAVIGRTDDNEVPIDHRSVSRHHAKIVTTMAGSKASYKIVDLGSSNGTLVNGEQYAQLALKAGDLIELGHVKLRFVPPGATYTLTPDERAAVRGQGEERPAPRVEAKPLPENEDSSDVGPVRRGIPRGFFGTIGAHPFRAVVGGAVVIASCVVVAWVLTRPPTTWPTGGDRAAVPPVGPIATAAPSAPTALPVIPSVPGKSQSNDPLLVQAREFMQKYEWAKALRLVKLVIDKEPSNEEALELVEVLSRELKAKELNDTINQAMSAEEWDSAWNALGEMPTNSVYAGAVEPLREQVRQHMVTDRCNRANLAWDEGKKRQAGDLLDEAEALAPTDPRVAEMRARFKTKARPTTPTATAKATGKTGTTATATGGEKTAGTPAAAGNAGGESSASSAPAAADASGGDAVSAYKLGLVALKDNQLDKAIDAFSRCVQVDRKSCNCYRALGIAHARNRDGTRAARYYKLYLKNCPDAPDAEQVRKMLEAYGGP
jgi:pSer/pThr/pTyr-binding forkhead associated (FHA) protein/TolA-binding protein